MYVTWSTAVSLLLSLPNSELHGWIKKRGSYLLKNVQTWKIDDFVDISIVHDLNARETVRRTGARRQFSHHPRSP